MTCAIPSYKAKAQVPARQQECSQHGSHDNYLSSSLGITPGRLNRNPAESILVLLQYHRMPNNSNS